MRNEEDIYIKVAERTGYSVELVKFAVKHFWKTVHFWLRNPLASGKAIKFEKGVKFYVRPYKLGYLIGGLEDDLEQGKGDLELIEAKLYYLKQVAKQQIEYERQASRSIENGRSSSKARRQRNREKRSANGS